MEQGDVDSNRQAYWRRSGRLAICPLSVADVAHQNEVIEQVTLRATHSQSTPTPKITDGFIIFDIERKQCHQIFVYRVDYRSGFSPSIGKVVKFSKRCYAPCRTKKLRLATPAYYRDHESLPPGILDPHESRIKKDATPWARNLFPYGSIKIKAVFSSDSEPWVYCASHLSSYHTSRNLKAKFSDEYDYDAATEIQDVDAFAMWLGIDFALRIDKDEHLKLEVLDTLVYWKNSYSTNLGQKEGVQNIDTVVHVYHGPVHYEDESGVIATNDDWTDIHGAVRAYFTKRTEFSDQSEYRFAVSTPGTPRDEIFELDISEDLRQLTSPK